MENLFNFILGLVLTTIMVGITIYGFIIGAGDVSLIMLVFSSFVLAAITETAYRKL